MCEGKTGIIISHRISSIKDIADRIAVFDKGIIQDEVTHNELLGRSTIYREMYGIEEGMD